jgi:hypothetical protein
MRLLDFISATRTEITLTEAKVVYDQMTSEGRLVEYMQQYPLWRKLFRGWHYNVRVTIADETGWANDLDLNVGQIS